MEGSLKRFLTTYAGAFAIGVVLTYLFLTLLIRAGHPVYVLVVLPLFFYVFMDLVVWLNRGVRSIEVTPGGLTARLARQAQSMRVERNEISGVYVSRFLDRTTVTILLRGATVRTLLGMRQYSGPRIRLTNEPFDRREFQEFVRRATKLRQTQAAS